MNRPFASALGALLAGACATAPAPPLPVTPTTPPAAFAGAAQGQAAQAPRTDWWAGLQDPQLDALIVRVFAANRDLKVAEAQVRQARALAKVERWNLLPTGGPNAGAGRARDAASGIEDEFVSVGAQAAWEVDLFGRIRAGADAAAADALATDQARRGVMSALAAETAQTYVDLRGVQARLAAAQANVAAQADTLRLTETLASAGRGTPLDVARARAQVEATRSAVPPLEAQIDADVAALDVLAGGLPADVKLALANARPTPLPSGLAFTGFPEDLVHRRPDILQAEARVQAASARVKAAKVDWWPRLTFLGSVSSVASGLSGLGARSGLSYSIGPQIDWPALDVRRNALRLEAARAGAEAEFLRFDQAVLSGVRDVETSLSALDAGRRATAQADAAAQAARQAADISRLRYRAGLDPFLNVLDAEGRLAEAEDRLAVARAGWSLNYVRLGRALGVGWSDPPAR